MSVERLSGAERAIADALFAIDYLQARQAADSATLRQLLAGRESDAATLAKIRANLSDQLAARPTVRPSGHPDHPTI